MNKFYGKYRGTVANNFDPLQQGRIQVSCPAVLGDGTLSWAMPCAPFAGPNVGIFTIPPRDSSVWVEFEEGDPNRPIWSGGFWAQGEAPATLTPVEDTKVVIKTNSTTITLSEAPGEDSLTFETTSGFRIVLGLTGVEITNGQGKITLQGPNVSVNDGALEVT